MYFFFFWLVLCRFDFYHPILTLWGGDDIIYITLVRKKGVHGRCNAAILLRLIEHKINGKFFILQSCTISYLIELNLRKTRRPNQLNKSLTCSSPS